MGGNLNIFESQSALDEYCAQITQTLTTHRNERIAFLRTVEQRLAPLLKMAEALQNSGVVAELSEQLEAAEVEIRHLEELDGAPLPE